MVGHGFMNLPGNAVAIIASSNDNPLEYKDLLDNNYIFTISERSDERIVFVHTTTSATSRDYYIGAIVSRDRSVVYWVNESRPLP